MRYRVIVSRAQVAERHVRASDEEDAAKKVQDELSQPYGFLGSCRTTNTDMDIVEAETVFDGSPPLLGSAGSLLLSIKNAAAHLGVSYSMMYEMVNTGEVAHVAIDTRKYIGREALNAFIEAHSHLGVGYRYS